METCYFEVIKLREHKIKPNKININIKWKKKCCKKTNLEYACGWTWDQIPWHILWMSHYKYLKMSSNCLTWVDITIHTSIHNLFCLANAVLIILLFWEETHYIITISFVLQFLIFLWVAVLCSYILIKI